jgi:hypothetical protein
MASRRIETGDGWKTGRPTPRGRHGRALSGLEVTLLGHASPSCSEHLVGLGPTSVSLPEVEMWNGGAAASIVPPTIYLPAGPGSDAAQWNAVGMWTPDPAGRRAAHPRSEAGRAHLRRERDLRTLKLAGGLEPQPAVYKTADNRPPGAGSCSPCSSRRMDCPASALLSARVVPRWKDNGNDMPLPSPAAHSRIDGVRLVNGATALGAARPRWVAWSRCGRAAP